MTTVYVLVTPHIAAQMMSYNINNNRRIDPRTVSQYAQAMSDKEWWWQAWMPIHFSDEARLINGQHKLQATIESGVSLPCMIVYNVPKDAVRGIDAGKKRTIAQQITLQGRDTKNAEVTIAATCWRLTPRAARSLTAVPSPTSSSSWWTTTVR